MVLLVRMLTWQSAVAGLGVTLCVVPLSILVGRIQTHLRESTMELTDNRVKLTGEVLSGTPSSFCCVMLLCDAMLLGLLVQQICCQTSLMLPQTLP